MKKGSSKSSSVGMQENDILFYVVVALGVIILAALVYFLFGQGKCFEAFTETPQSPTLEYYYMKQCPHCNTFNPEWEKVEAKLAASKPVVNTKKIDIDENQELAKANGVNGAPTLLFIKDGVKKEYSGERNVESIVEFVTSS